MTKLKNKGQIIFNAHVCLVNDEYYDLELILQKNKIDETVIYRMLVNWPDIDENGTALDSRFTQSVMCNDENIIEVILKAVSLLKADVPESYIKSFVSIKTV